MTSGGPWAIRMADDPTPTWIPRAQTQPEDRDEISDRARADRRTPAPISNDVTGEVVAVYDEIAAEDAIRLARERKEALRSARASRPTNQRLELLETKHDALDEKVDGMALVLAKIDGKMDILPSRIDDAVKSARDAANEVRARDHVTYTQSVEIDTAKATGAIETATAERRGAIEDANDARRSRRTRITKLVGLFTSGAVVAEVLHVRLERLT